ncbi:MAG: 6-phosphofructokinase [Gammaproteobacteria bacterium]|nr:6-phosphofructokinase [Gammaproteobacteria bacterium]
MKNKKIQNAFYAQSGGVTAVINATACGIIEAARSRPDKIGTVLAGKNGIIGALQEELIDTHFESNASIQALRYTPGGAFGSCRYKLKSLEKDPRLYKRLIEVFKAHEIGYFFYNGGGDSQDTAHKIGEASKKFGFPLLSIGIPKTIDNDLAMTDNCPGFGSVAKYVAVSTREAGLDVLSMAETSTKVFILEVMGRNTGWIAASSGLAKDKPEDPPHLILFPEIPFQRPLFLKKVAETIQRIGYCVIVASEGVKHESGNLLSASSEKDAFGHTQLGGVAPLLSQWIQSELNLKVHWAVSDYLQRSARHIASGTDVEQAYALGRVAVDFALAGKSDIMPIIRRESSSPYRWSIGEAPLSCVANVEKTVPRTYITLDGFNITPSCREYLSPLIQGEDFPPFQNGLPVYARLQNKEVSKKLPPFEF